MWSLNHRESVADLEPIPPFCKSTQGSATGTEGVAAPHARAGEGRGAFLPLQLPQLPQLPAPGRPSYSHGSLANLITVGQEEGTQ